MKMKLKYYMSAILASSVLYAFAQQTDRNVTVEREYKPVIQDAGKISQVPEVTTTDTRKANAEYNEIELPMSMGQNIQILSAADLELEKRKDPAASFVRVGLGNYNINMLDFAMPLVRKADMRLDLKANHFATFGGKDHSNTNASMLFNTYLDKIELFAGLSGGYEYFNYYGKNFNALGQPIDLDSLKSNPNTVYTEQNMLRISRNATDAKLSALQNAPTWNDVWRFNTYFGVCSKEDAKGLRYEASVNYNRSDTRLGLIEDKLYTKAGFSNANGKDRMGMDIELQNMFYSSDKLTDSMNVWDSYSVFSMNPYYSFERANWKVRLGVKTSFSFVYGKPFSPSPDIFAEWQAVPEWFAVYGGLTGGYKINSQDVAVSENRYIYPDLRLLDTYTPFYLYAGIKLKPVYNLLIDAYLSYRYIDQQYFFVNKSYTTPTSTSGYTDEKTLYTNMYNAVYSSASLVNIGLRANYNIRNTLNLQLKTVFNNWKTFDTEMAWMKPKFETDITGEYRISRGLNVNASLYYCGERYAKLGTLNMRMKPYLDVNTGVSYTLDNWLTLFIKANNIFNANYDEFYGYRTQGLNYMFGASFAF